RLNDDLRIRSSCLARQGEAVADEVRDAVEDLGRHVVMAEDDRVLLALQRVDRGDGGRKRRPLDLRHDVRNLLIEPSRFAGDLGCVSQPHPNLLLPSTIILTLSIYVGQKDRLSSRQYVALCYI